MEAYIESLYSEDNDFEIYFRESSLTSKKCINEILNAESMFYEDGDEEGKPGIIKTIINKIGEFIKNIQKRISGFISVIRNSFGSKLTTGAYMQSDAANVRVSADIEKITKQIEDEILSERKGVQLISKAISKLSSKTELPIDLIIDKKMIGKVLDDASAFVAKNGEKVIAAGAATIIGNKLQKCLEDSKGITEELDDLTKQYEDARRNVHREKVKHYDQTGHHILKYMEKLTYTVDVTTRRAEKYYIAITKPIAKFKNKFNSIS